jgi:hypothetical protein
MNWLKNLAVIAIALVLTNSADAAGKGKKKAKPIKGEVVDVKKDADKESGSLVVKVAAKKKTGGAPTEKTIKVTDATKVLKVTGGKKNKDVPATPSKLSDLQKGTKVVVTVKGDEASEIKFVAKKTKKNKK